MNLIKHIFGWMGKYYHHCKKFEIVHTERGATIKLMEPINDTIFRNAKNELLDTLKELGYEQVQIIKVSDEITVIQVQF